MKDLMKRYWHRVLVWLAFIPVCIRIFLKWTPLAIGLAAIPVEQYVTMTLVNKAGLGLVTARLIGFVMTFFLMFLAWHVGEIIVALMAAALVGEAYNLVQCIKDRIHDMGEGNAEATA